MLVEAKNGQQSQPFPRRSEGRHVHYVVLGLVLVFRIFFFFFLTFLFNLFTTTMSHEMGRENAKFETLKHFFFSFSHWHMKGKDFHQNA